MSLKFNLLYEQIMYQLLCEATDEEVELILFFTTIKPIRTYIDAYIKNMVLNNYNNITINQYISTDERKFNLKNKIKLNQKKLLNCNVTVDKLSNKKCSHAIFGYLTRLNINKIREIFNKEVNVEVIDKNKNKKICKTNKEIYDWYCDTILGVDSITILNKTTLPRYSCTSYQIDQDDLQLLTSNIEQQLNNLETLLNNVIDLILKNKKYGLYLDIDSELRIICKPSTNLTIGLFCKKTGENSFNLNLGNIYPSKKNDKNTNIYTPYVIDEF